MKDRRRRGEEKRERKSMLWGKKRNNEKDDYMNEKERIVSFIGENISSVMQFLILSNKKIIFLIFIILLFLFFPIYKYFYFAT